MGLLNLDALEAFEMVDHGDLSLCDFAIAVQAGGGLSDFDFALDDFSEGDAPEVIAVIKIGDENLETFAGLCARRGNVLHDRVEERFHGSADVIQFELCVAALGAAVNERKIELLVSGVQGNEQF